MVALSIFACTICSPSKCGRYGPPGGHIESNTLRSARIRKLKNTEVHERRGSSTANKGGIPGSERGKGFSNLNEAFGYELLAL